MLRRLLVKNFAIVPEVSIQFSSGLNVLTGETGAGKSILIDAIGLLAGRRASEEDVRCGEEMAVVEGTIEVSKSSPLWRFLKDSGVPMSDGEIVVRRTVSGDGRSRAYVNDWQWTVSGLSQLAAYWIDISGQHGQQKLLDDSTHLDLLDEYIPFEAREKYRGCYTRVKNLDDEIRSLRERREIALKEREYLEFQWKELNGANLKPGEEAELQSVHARMANSEKLARACAAVEELLSGDAGIAAQAGRLENEVQGMQKFDPSLTAWMEEVGTIRTQVEELAVRASRYSQGFEFEPDELERMNERLAMLQKFSRKYGSMDKAISERDRIGSLLSSLENFEADEGGRIREREEAAKELAAEAEKLTKVRKKLAKEGSQRITLELRQLGMPAASAEWRFLPVVPGEGTVEYEGKCFNASGAETAALMLAPNPGEGIKSLSKIASGGELSRVLLAIKGMTLENRRAMDCTFLFDEVDSGIGGETAEIVGIRLRNLSAGKQVLCVTHLAQIACYADVHLAVSKEIKKGRTVASVYLLESDGRAMELARMIGGVKITPKTRDYADELLKKGTIRKNASSPLAS